MATPAAILSILVKTQGAQAAAADIGKLDKQARTAGAGLSNVEAHAKRTHKTLGLVGAAARTAGPLIGAAGLAAGVKTAVSEFREAQKTGAQTAAVLKSTGGAAKVTKKHIEDLAGAISKKSGIDDEAIQSTENLLLTFTKIRNETGKGNKIFDQATQAVTDMSVALGQSGKSSAIQLGKALNDPIKGVTALQRVGVAFTADQKKQITGLVEHGKKLEAQKIILREVTTEFGGSAAAQATAGDKLKVSMGNLAEAVGGILVPVLDTAARWMAGFIDQLVRGQGVARFIIPVFLGIRDAIAASIPVIASVVTWLRTNATVAAVFAAGVQLASAAFNAIKGAAVALAPVIAALWVWFTHNETAMLAVAAAAGVLFAAFVALKVIQAIQGMVVALRTAWVLLNATFLLSPVGLVVLGLAALAAGLVIAYRQSATFRSIVQGAWSALQTAAQTVFPIIKKMAEVGLLGPIGLAITHWSTFKSFLSTTWGAIKTAAAVWVSIASAITTPIRAAITLIKDLIGGKGLAKAMSDAWSTIKSGAAAFAGDLKNAIVGAFSSAANAVVGFVNAIIKVVNAIPGIPNIKPVSLGGGDSKPRSSPTGSQKGFARGGAFARTGGYVNAPMTLMGEEAPRFPEFVIPTNPAYRGRAQGLLAQAAGAVGFARGGKYDFTGLEQLWTGVGGRPSAAAIMAHIAQAESGGDPNARNPSGASGLWQILGLPFPGDPFNPATNARMAIAKSGNGANLHPWDASRGVWAKFLGGGGDPIGNAVGNVAGKIGKSIGALLGKLPGVGDLPGWIQGLGKYVLGKAKDAIGGMFGGGGGGTPGGARGPAGVGTFGGVPMANWVIQSLQDAQRKGVGVRPTSGYRPGVDTHTASGRSEHQGIQFPHGAVDFGGPVDRAAYAMKMGVVGATRDFKYPLLAPVFKYNPAAVGGADDGHASGTGHRKGGIYGPYIGSYATGGVIPQTGLGLLHRGETVVPTQHLFTGGQILKKAGKTMTGNQAWTLSDMAKPWAQWTGDHWVVADPGKGGTWNAYKSGKVVFVPASVTFAAQQAAQAAAAAGSGSGDVAAADTVDTTPFSQADVDALQASIDALNDQLARANQIAELQAQQYAAIQRNYAVSQTHYSVLAKAIADVASGQIGGRVGLGFMTPSFAGGGTRY